MVFGTREIDKHESARILIIKETVKDCQWLFKGDVEIKLSTKYIVHFHTTNFLIIFQLQT